ncbi:MAG: thiamine pyrophosphate-dependent enzyme [bacterium]|nr:thiamine pyrophosphate-dependent enzyme [bacterium]
MTTPLKNTDFNTTHFPTWCPGCGDFGIWTALKNALAALEMKPSNVLIVYGIGCSGNMSSFIKSYGFHGLHGRALPAAIGAKLANKNLKVIVVGGDGDGYGEGGNHFIHALRGNVDITYIVHDNQVYGLTKGQMAPTTELGQPTSSTPEGTVDQALNPVALAIAAGGSFVSQGFAGDVGQLTQLIVDAVKHPGFSHVNVLQPCVTFNHHNTFSWFFKRVYKVESVQHDFSNKYEAFARALEWGDKIPTGLLYREIRPTWVDRVHELDGEPLATRRIDTIDISKTLQSFT